MHSLLTLERFSSLVIAARPAPAVSAATMPAAPPAALFAIDAFHHAWSLELWTFQIALHELDPACRAIGTSTLLALALTVLLFAVLFSILDARHGMDLFDYLVFSLQSTTSCCARPTTKSLDGRPPSWRSDCACSPRCSSDL